MLHLLLATMRHPNWMLAAAGFIAAALISYGLSPDRGDR
ncbi:hypothetical protein ABH925_001187 [Streptacidiphilus sp. EB129]